MELSGQTEWDCGADGILLPGCGGRYLVKQLTLGHDLHVMPAPRDKVQDRSPLSRHVGTRSADMLVSPMKLVGAAVSKTARSVRLRPSAAL